jgi:hypothetical protein
MGSLHGRLERLEAQAGTDGGLPPSHMIVRELALLESWLAGQGLTAQQAVGLGMECPECRFVRVRDLLPDAGEGAA